MLPQSLPASDDLAKRNQFHLLAPKAARPGPVGMPDLSTLWVVLGQRDHRTLIHSLAILHAWGIFARVSVVTQQPAEARTWALIDALNLRSYIEFLDPERPLSRPGSLHACALTCPDLQIRSLLTDRLIAGYSAIGVVPDLAEPPVEHSELVMSLDAQGLAGALRRLFIY